MSCLSLVSFSVLGLFFVGLTTHHRKIKRLKDAARRLDQFWLTGILQPREFPDLAPQPTKDEWRCASADYRHLEQHPEFRADFHPLMVRDFDQYPWMKDPSQFAFLDC